MKATRTMAVLLCSAVLSLSIGCGGGGGDDSEGGGGGGTTPLATGTFMKTVAPAQDTAFSAPFWVQANHDQHLVFASDIQGAGYIDAISLRMEGTNASVVTCPSVTIKMGHTIATALTVTFASNVEQGQGAFATVLSAGTVTIPTGSAGDYFTIALDTPFYYNGVENLVVDITSGTACTGGVILDAAAVADTVVHSLSTSAATGTLYAVYLNMKFHFSGGDDILDFGGASGNALPFRPTPDHVQMLYLASDITGSGPITGIGFQVNTAVISDASYTYTIKMGHTMLSALTTTFADNFDAGSPVTVATDVLVNISGSVPGGRYIWLPLDGTFTYNGQDNLLVDIDVTGATSDNVFLRLAAGPADVRLDGPTGATTGTLSNVQYHAKFRFNGGTLDTVTPGSSYSFPPFSNASSHRQQFLYPAVYLGTGGSISKIAFRLKNNSAAGTYNNFAITLGHTLLSGLTQTYASNMVDAAVVYSGMVSIPAGLKAGDWFEVALDTPFVYDGARNLVVDTIGDMGSAMNSVVADGLSAEYTNYHMFSLSRTSPTGARNNAIADQRLWVTK